MNSSKIGSHTYFRYFVDDHILKRRYYVICIQNVDGQFNNRKQRWNAIITSLYFDG